MLRLVVGRLMKNSSFWQQSFEGKKIDRFWVALEEIEETGCSWRNFSPDEDFQYLQEYISKAGKMGMKMEIASMIFEWIAAFKDQKGFPDISRTSQFWWFHKSQ